MLVEFASGSPRLCGVLAWISARYLIMLLSTHLQFHTGCAPNSSSSGSILANNQCSSTLSSASFPNRSRLLLLDIKPKVTKIHTQSLEITSLVYIPSTTTSAQELTLLAPMIA
jgi:hypothetical protein